MAALARPQGGTDDAVAKAHLRANNEDENFRARRAASSAQRQFNDAGCEL